MSAHGYFSFSKNNGIHSAVNIHNLLDEFLSEWVVYCKIKLMTSLTDNDSNIVAAFKVHIWKMSQGIAMVMSW